MTIKEQLYEKIEQTDEAVLVKWLEELSKLEETPSPDPSQAIALWEVLAEPMSEEDSKLFAEATQRRPFFAEERFTVQPD